MAAIMGMGLPSMSNVFIIMIWLFAFLVVGILIFATIFLTLFKKNLKKVVEINMVNKRLRIFHGRLKKKSKGNKLFWSYKIGRFLPNFQQKSVFVKGKQDTIILVKDNNGLYHTARLPTYKELRKWYRIVHNKNLDNMKEGDKITDMYLLPSPHEDLDFLADQCVEADKEFKVEKWWQSPTVAYIATGFICMMMIVMSLIIEKKF